MVPRWAVFRNLWPTRSCSLRPSGAGSWDLEIEQDFPRSTPHSDFALRSLVIHWDADHTVALPFPKRPQAHLPDGPEWQQSAAQFFSRSCAATDTDCYSYLNLRLPTNAAPRHVQAMIGTFTEDDPAAYKNGFVITLSESIRSDGSFPSVTFAPSASNVS